MGHESWRRIIRKLLGDRPLLTALNYRGAPLLPSRFHVSSSALLFAEGSRTILCLPDDFLQVCLLSTRWARAVNQLTQSFPHLYRAAIAICEQVGRCLRCYPKQYQPSAIAANAPAPITVVAPSSQHTLLTTFLVGFRFTRTLLLARYPLSPRSNLFTQSAYLFKIYKMLTSSFRFCSERIDFRLSWAVCKLCTMRY